MNWHCIESDIIRCLRDAGLRPMARIEGIGWQWFVCVDGEMNVSKLARELTKLIEVRRTARRRADWNP